MLQNFTKPFKTLQTTNGGRLHLMIGVIFNSNIFNFNLTVGIDTKVPYAVCKLVLHTSCFIFWIMSLIFVIVSICTADHKTNTCNLGIMFRAGSCLILLTLLLDVSWQERSPKKGVVIPSWPKHHCYDWYALYTVGWWYNYHPVPDVEYYNKWWCTYMSGAVPHGDARECCFPNDPTVEFMPMVYGVPGVGHHANTDFPDVPDEYNIVLGFNEPNRPEQANLTPEEAALAWIEFQEKYPGKELVSPATAGADTEWFDAFMEACDVLGCRFDYLATHLYTGGTAEKTMKILKDYSDRYGGKKIWFTEFAMAREHNEHKIISLINDLVPQLEHSDFIYRYSWFVSRYYEVSYFFILMF